MKKVTEDCEDGVEIGRKLSKWIW